MTRKKTDFRRLRARREAALARPEIGAEPKPEPLDERAIAAAIAQGKLTRLPPRRRKR